MSVQIQIALKNIVGLENLLSLGVEGYIVKQNLNLTQRHAVVFWSPAKISFLQILKSKSHQKNIFNGVNAIIFRFAKKEEKGIARGHSFIRIAYI